MPQAYAALKAFAVLYAKQIAIAKTILGAGLIVHSVLQAKAQRRAARSAYESSLRDRSVVLRSSDATRSIIYGRARVSGPLCFACNSGTKSEYLHMVIALAGHEIDAVEDVWAGDESIGPLNGDGYVTTGRYFKTRTENRTHKTTVDVAGEVVLPEEPLTIDTVVVSTSTVESGYTEIHEGTGWSRSGATLTLLPEFTSAECTVSYRVTVANPLLRVRAFLGAPEGHRDVDLETASAGAWTPAHLGKGVPRLHVTMRYDEEVFVSGIPQFSAVVRGKRVRDLRTDTVAWSNNAELCVLDYLTDPLGFGEAWSALDPATAIANASICDETIPDGEEGGQARYTCDGVLDTGDDRIQNLAQLLTAMVGSAVLSGGSWYVRAGAYVVPALDLDESDLADGAIEVAPRLPRRELFNGVRGRFVDPENGYQVVDFPPYRSAVYQAADGGEEILRDIELPFTADVQRAQRLAKLILHRSRQAVTVSATWKLGAYPLQAANTCRLSISRYGWDKKVFRVLDRRLVQPGTVKLVLQEEAPDVYAWDFDEAVIPDPAPNTSLPAAWVVATPAGLLVSSGAGFVRTMADGSRQAFARVSWTPYTEAAVTQGGSIEVYWKRAPEVEYQRLVLPGSTFQVDLDVTNGETYNVAVRARNGAQASSNYAVAAHTVTGAPENLAANVTPGAITADRLAALPSNESSITPDPAIEDETAWIVDTAERVTNEFLPFGRYAWRGAGTSARVFTRPVPIDSSKSYRASAYAVASGDSTRITYLFCRFLNAEGNEIHDSLPLPGWGGGGTYHYFGLVGQTPTTAWREYSIVFGRGADAPIPPDARFVSIGALIHYDDLSPRAGTNYVGGMRIQIANGSDLLVPGAATTVLRHYLVEDAFGNGRKMIFDENFVAEHDGVAEVTAYGWGEAQRFWSGGISKAQFGLSVYIDDGLLAYQKAQTLFEDYKAGGSTDPASGGGVATLTMPVVKGRSYQVVMEVFADSTHWIDAVVSDLDLRVTLVWR